MYGCYVKAMPGAEQTHANSLNFTYEKSCRFVFSGMTEPLSDMLGVSVATDSTEDVQ